MESQHAGYIKKLIISRNDDPYISDKAALGAQSRCLQTETNRMRILTFPPGYEADHVCFKGHSIFILSGECTLEMENDKIDWKQGDAFIIPEGIPHRLLNAGASISEIIIFDATLPENKKNQ